MIDYISDDSWQPQIEHPFSPSDKAIFTNLLFKDDFWCRKNCFDCKKPEYKSKDDMVRVYLNGFEDTIDNYIQSIYQFME